MARTKPKIELDANQVEQMSALGMTTTDIAHALGISPATFFNRKRDNIEFREAVERGRAKGILKVTKNLMKNIDNGDVKAQSFYLSHVAKWNKVENKVVNNIVLSEEMGSRMEDIFNSVDLESDKK